MKRVRPGRAKPEHSLGHKKSVTRDEALVSGYASGPVSALGKPSGLQNKAGYKDAADFFTEQNKFFLLLGRHPYKAV